MTYANLVRARLDTKLATESRDTFEAVKRLGSEYRSRGTYGSGPYVDEAMKLFMRGLERPVKEVLDGLRSESEKLPKNAVTELLSAATEQFKNWIAENSRRRRLNLKQELECVGHWSQSHDLMTMQGFGQLTVDLVSRTQLEIHEIGLSHRLLVEPRHAPDQALAKLVEDVSRLVELRGDVEEFIRQNTSRLEQIEKDLKQQGSDVQFTADLVMQMGIDKLTARNGLSQLVSGVATNAIYDQLKNFLIQLSGALGS